MNVLITRTAEQSVDTVNLLSAAGLSPYCLPMIEIVAQTPDFSHSSYDLCILSSPAAVKYFLPHYKHLKIWKFIAVGAKTAEALTAATGATDILVPEKFYMADIAAKLDKWDLAGLKVLSPGAETRATDMHAFFAERGAIYEAPTTYQTLPVKYDDNYVGNFIHRYDINTVTFLSPSAAKTFFDQTELDSSVKIVAIGTTTKAVIPDRYNVLMPETQTMEGIVKLLRS
ncbi:MAG: uroporphyrinogen-III synthase [Deferribacteraceae bacterium]|jgi:uroporphyrinogen-III synthase|nr:uroporphyrinogen-III synthase [Deferribacteraceae bacterium]